MNATQNNHPSIELKSWAGILLALIVVAVVSNATAAAQVAEGDGYQSALVNFRFIANTVWTTEQATQAIAQAK